jgi:ligand-binding sensor domain-containing protein
MNKAIHILIILLITIHLSYSQTNEWIAYNNQNSLITGVSKILMDNDGIAWIASNGLVKTDGVNWTLFTTSNSELPHNNIYDITIDKTNNIWIATGNGLAKFNPTLNEWNVFNSSNSPFPSNWVSAIAVDKNNNIWIGIERKLIKFDGINFTVNDTSETGIPKERIRTIAIDPNNSEVWTTSMALGGGVSKFNGTNWTSYNPSNSGLTNEYVNYIAIDSSSVKWIGATQGLFVFDDVSWSVYNASFPGCYNDFFYSVTIDKENNKWLGTRGGVAKFDGTTWTSYNLTNSGITSDFVTSIAVDRGNNKWIGLISGTTGTGGGLNIFNENGLTVSIANNKLSEVTEIVSSRIFPNPFSYSATLEISSLTHNHLSLLIYNQMGQVVYQKKEIGSREQLNLSLSKGMYYYRIVGENELQSQGKFVVKY